MQVVHICKEAATVSRVVVLPRSVCCGNSFSPFKSGDKVGWSSRVAPLIHPGYLQTACFGGYYISSSEDQTSKKRVGVAVTVTQSLSQWFKKTPAD